jgi:hypothetical protein
MKSAHRAEQYRNNRLFYERPADARPAKIPPNIKGASPRSSAAPANLRLCVYTCLIGATEMLNEQPVAAASSIPFICFTDDPDRRSQTWQMRPISPLFELDPVRSQRAVKLRPHEYLPNFDVSLYIDNSVLLDKLPEDLIAEHLPQSGLCLAEHSFRDTVLDEFLAVSTDGLDDQTRIFEQLNHYALSCPDVLQEKPYWGGILLRDHRNPALRDMLELWFAHVQRYSRRDQLSINFALRRAGLTPDVLSIDNHRSSYHTWPHKMPSNPPLRVYRPVAAYGTLGARIRDLEINHAAEKRLFEARLAELLEEKQNTGARMDELLAENQRTSARLREFIEAQQATGIRIHELEMRLAREKQKYEALSAELMQERDRNRTRLRELTEEKDRAGVLVGDLESSLLAEQRRIQALQASASWRLTAPIRKVGTLLKD